MHCPRIVTAALCAAALIAEAAQAQQLPQRPRPGQPGTQQGTGGRTTTGGGQGQNRNRPADEPPQVKLPEDPKLLKIHEAFVLSAMKLAQEYENARDIDKAATCYEEILRLVPSYAEAADKLKSIKAKEAIAERKPFEVWANRGWQDTGITVVEGKPVSVRASGTWSLKMAYTLPPDGIEIPKELQELPLGALVGVIADANTKMDEAKPFLVGANKSFEPDMSGRLFLRIYDSDPTDNTGKLNVVIEGTFQK